MRGAISCIWRVCFAPIYSVLSVINFELSSTVNTCLWDTWKEKAWFWSSTTAEKNSMELKFHKELAWTLKQSSHIVTPHKAFKTLYWMVIPFQLAIDRERETKLWIDCRMQWWIVSLTMPRDHRYSIVIWPAILWCYGDECCQSRSIVVLLTHYHNLPDLLMYFQLPTVHLARSFLPNYTSPSHNISSSHDGRDTKERFLESTSSYLLVIDRIPSSSDQTNLCPCTLPAPEPKQVFQWWKYVVGTHSNTWCYNWEISSYIIGIV